MKITDVEALHLRLPQVEEIADGTQDVLIVRIHTDAGLVGIGEVSSQSYVCKAIFEAPRSAERRHGLAYLLRGQDPLDVGALWDLRGKAAGKPVYELLGEGCRGSIRAYASYLFGSTPRETGELARQAVDLGLTAMKFGWGPFGQDLSQDLAHVEAARRAAGPSRDVMVDAGLAFSVQPALERARLLQQFDIGWLEEPLSQDDLRGYAELCAASPVPIAAGEGEVTRWGFEALIECGVAVLQPDVAICGGLTVARQVSELARAAQRKCVPHCFSTGVNLAASLHWMAAFGDENALVEYCLRPSALMRKLVRNLPPLVDGYVQVPQGPGLGIELDPDIIEQFRVA